MHKVIEEKVVDGFFYFFVYVSVCLFDVGNGVEGVCGVFCVNNVQR
jgi:hypothetical protein